MPDDEPPPPRPSSVVVLHPAPLNTLTDIFGRRRIAVGIDSSGQVILARPNSLVVEVTNREQRESVASYVERYDKDEANGIRERGDDKGPQLETLRFKDVDRERINGEDRWTFSRVQQAIRELATLEKPVVAELNHVFLGAQTVVGSPLGAPATWAGEMAFLGNVIETKEDDKGVKRRVMLSTVEPAEQPRFLRSRLDIKGRRRPQILVLDTGLETVEQNGQRRTKHDFLDCCIVDQTTFRSATPTADGTFPVDDEDEPDDDKTGTLDFEGGHGTFIAGVIAQLCPDADVHTAGVLSSFGDGDVSEVIAGLQKGIAAAKTSIDIVVMSFGAFFADDDPGIFGSSLVQLLGDRFGVAAAGNQATCRPYFPAGLNEVKGIGAVAAGGRAWFSNWGGWVDACAPGVDVVSTFFDFSEDLSLFPDLDDVKPRMYKGWARWSGTSFSAPKVAATLAQEMYLNLNDAGTDLVTAQEAWRRLTTHNHLRMPDLGVVFNA